MTVTKETFTCLLSFRFHSNVGVVKMWDWPKAKFLASLDSVPRGVFLSKGLFLSIKDSVRIWPGMEERPVALVVKNPPANAGDRDAVSIPELGGSPGGGHSNLLQYSCLENPMDRGAWGLWSIGSQRVGHG